MISHETYGCRDCDARDLLILELKAEVAQWKALWRDSVEEASAALIERDNALGVCICDECS